MHSEGPLVPGIHRAIEQDLSLLMGDCLLQHHGGCVCERESMCVRAVNRDVLSQPCSALTEWWSHGREGEKERERERARERRKRRRRKK